MKDENKTLPACTKTTLELDRKKAGPALWPIQRLRNQIATLRDEKPQSLEKILEQTCHEVQQMQRTALAEVGASYFLQSA